jgi:amidase
MSDPLAFLDATAQAELVRRGDASPLELVDAAIARIERLDPQLNAVIHRNFDRARELANGKLPDGPFRGVPFLLKDLDVAADGLPMHAGTRFLKEAGYVSAHDSYLVSRFAAAGLVTVGKTNTPEFGLNITTEPEAWGASHNPWNLEHSTGGSSGGSAAAVAAGLVPIAHASDGGGSIRIPASECGLVGLKPSRGRISLGPEHGEYWSGLVANHVVSRSVRDTAIALDCVAGEMPGDPYVAPAAARSFAAELEAAPRRLRIGVVRKVPNGTVTLHPDCIAAVDATAGLLSELGHAVVESHPVAMEEVDATSTHFTTLVCSWVAASLERWGQDLGRTIGAGDVEPATWLFAEIGRTVTAAQYIHTLQELHAYTRRMASWWADGFDVLLTPTLGEPPPRLGELVPPRDNPLAGLARTMSVMPFTAMFNITGQPAISLPLHWNEAGLPIGLQFVGAYGREDVLVGLAAQLEAARPWAKRRPAVHA